MSEPGWPVYECHKVVRALPIVSLSERTLKTDRQVFVRPPGQGLERFRPTNPGMVTFAEVGGYAVIYQDGYRSILTRAALSFRFK
jgi:hypothetical protein